LEQGLHRIGVISDTHDLLRAEALEALAGSELIIHAGDVGDAGILERLGEIAPVVAVRGNTDWGPLGDSLPLSEVVEVDDLLLYVLHISEDLDINLKATGVSMMIHGHTHRTRVEWAGDILFLNPGSAGPRRFGLPATVARLTIAKKGGAGPTGTDPASTSIRDRIQVEIIELKSLTPW